MKTFSKIFLLLLVIIALAITTSSLGPKKLKKGVNSNQSFKVPGRPNLKATQNGLKPASLNGGKILKNPNRNVTIPSVIKQGSKTGLMRADAGGATDNTGKDLPDNTEITDNGDNGGKIPDNGQENLGAY